MDMIEIEITKIYKKWFDALDKSVRLRVQKRIDQITLGNFGDCKALGENVYEMRFHFGAGYRVYYTWRGKKLLLLLAGGDKSTQRSDIAVAKYIAKEREI